MREATISRTPRCRGSSSPTRSSAGRKTVWSFLCLFILAYGRRFWLAERGCRRRVSANQKRPHGKHEAGRRTEARSCCLEAATWLSLCLALAIWIALERDLNSDADIKIFVNVKKIFQPLCWEEELRQQKRDSFRPGCVRQVRNISETIYSSKSPTSPPLSSSAIFCS